ncbi:MAG: AMIN domain-containing protein, partial [Desulfobulbaceae bacterium]|nr:AMIN domain-containing protein [Desulfobulbaceae bacterium]
MFCFFLLPQTAQAVPSASASPVQKKYRMARAYYHNLQSNKSWAESRKKWQTSIKAFRKVYQAHPDHWLAPSCLFSMAMIYHDDMYARFKNPLYLGESIANYEDVISLFPKHRLADDALYAIGKIYLEDKRDDQRAAKTFAKLIAVYPDGDMTPNGALLLKKIKGHKETIRPAKSKDRRAKIQDLRHGSTKYYTRVVIEVSQQVEYKTNLLEKSGNRPRRLYVNLYNCKVSPDLNPTIPIQDGLLKQVRSAQFSIDTARVVLDTETVSDYKINTLKDPFRVVVDVWGIRQKSGIAAQYAVEAPSLPQQLGLGARRIVLDPGHGGKDPGAIGPNGMREKDIVLKVAKKAA